MGKHQSDFDFLRTRSAVAIAGKRCVGDDHLEMVDRLSRKDGSGREFGPAQHRRLAMEVAAGSAVVACAEIASRVAPGIDWAAHFTRQLAPDGAQKEDEGHAPATDPGDRDPG